MTFKSLLVKQSHRTEKGALEVKIEVHVGFVGRCICGLRFSLLNQDRFSWFLNCFMNFRGLFWFYSLNELLFLCLMYFIFALCLFSDIKGIINLSVGAVIKTIRPFRCSTQISVLCRVLMTFLLVWLYFFSIGRFVLDTRLILHLTVRTVFDFNFWRKSDECWHRITSDDLRYKVSLIIEIKVLVDIVVLRVDVLS
jgi:4-amino-4-deoxy-L-arabinose transferase-like glycosyltransferase